MRSGHGASALVVLLAAMALLGRAAWAADSLETIRDDAVLQIDRSQISVSGLSSGGWMANQLHIAYSETFMGAGVIAGGPYHCAGSPSWTCDYTPYGFYSPHDSCQATLICTRLARKTFGWYGIYLGPPDAQDSLDSTLAEAAAGTIDPLSGLKGDRVWLFSGRDDSLVPQGVMDQLEAYYETLFARPEVGNPASDMRYENGLAVEHAMIISVPGPEEDNDCDYYGPPYINDCDYAAAGEMLKFLYDRPDNGAPPQLGDWQQDNLREFDQRPFSDSGDPSVSLNEIGHIYVPQACQGGAACPLHVALHGCEQYQEAIDQVCGVERQCTPLFYFRDAGYNEWAERLGIVVLYPQTTAWGAASDGAKNPKGCWDWWGYSGDDYFRKSAKQMTAIQQMIDCVSGGSCL